MRERDWEGVGWPILSKQPVENGRGDEEGGTHVNIKEGKTADMLIIMEMLVMSYVIQRRQLCVSK